jgi:truncated hemoglobin YjbI
MRLFCCTLLSLTLLGCPSKKPEAARPGAPPPATKPAQSWPSATQARAPVTLKILSPKEGEALSEKKPLSVTFSLTNYELQPDGQRLHVIIDNNPYEPYYDLSKPFVPKALLAPGTHTIRAFPVGGPLTDGLVMHEAIKDPGAFASVTFSIGKANGKNTPKPGDPLLTFSRPSGEYTGEKARKILLDFWIKNAELGPDKYKVKYSIDKGRERTLDAWEKIFLEDLEAGDHAIEMWLVGPDGQEASGPFNRTTRKFSLKETAPKTLYERIGGQAIIEATLRDLFLAIALNTEVNKSFAKVDLLALKRDLGELLCEASGGPCLYTGEPLKTAHPKMKLSEKDFLVLRQELTKALTQNQIPKQERGELQTLFANLKSQLVRK